MRLSVCAAVLEHWFVHQRTLGCKGFFVFWRVFFVQHVRSCTSLSAFLLDLCWCSERFLISSVKVTAVAHRFEAFLFQFNCVIFARTSWSGCAAERIPFRPRSAEMMRIRGRSVSLWARPSALYTLRRGELFPVSRITFHRWLSDWSELRKTEGGVGRVDVRLKQKRKKTGSGWRREQTLHAGTIVPEISNRIEIYFHPLYLRIKKLVREKKK